MHLAGIDLELKQGSLHIISLYLSNEHDSYDFYQILEKDLGIL